MDFLYYGISVPEGEVIELPLTFASPLVGRRWVGIVVRNQLGGSRHRRFRASLKSEKDGSASQVAETSEEVDFVLLEVRSNEPSSISLWSDAGAVSCSVGVVDAVPETSISIPFSELGRSAEEVEMVNKFIRHQIAVSLSEVDDGARPKKKKPKVYICGLNHKNHGTECTVVNLIICSKKDQRPIEPGVPSAPSPAEPVPDDNGNPDGGRLGFAPSFGAYIELIRHCGSFEFEVGDKDIAEFNDVACVLRALESKVDSHWGE